MLGVKSAIVRRLILTLLLFVEMTTFFVYFNADFYLQERLYRTTLGYSSGNQSTLFHHSRSQTVMKDKPNKQALHLSSESIPTKTSEVYNESMTIEKFRYRTDSAGANGTHGLVAELSLYRDSGELSRLGFPVRSFTIKRRDTESLRRPSDELVFVTAASENFVTPVFTAIALVQKYFPASPIYFYDLSDVDLGNGQQLRRFCNVRYRKFDFSSYPKHVQELRIYAFKPIIIHELLHVHETIFWVDSSIRMLKSDLSQVYEQASTTGRGIVMFDVTGHNIFMATHPDMYRYLPITKESAINVDMHGAGDIFIRRSKQLYENVFKWWFLCALERGCIAPPDADLGCSFHGSRQYGHCHRYDQSALNILLANWFHDDHVAYMFYSALRGGPVLTVRRYVGGQEQPVVCDNSTINDAAAN